MAQRIMDIHASENKYLHRNFHVSADNGLRYVGENYGDNGVKEYLRTFTKAYYRPMISDVQKRGLIALKEQIEKIYIVEEMPETVKITFSEDELVVEIKECPAISHFNNTGYHPSKWYIELTRTVNETIADLCNLGFEMISYDEVTGMAKYRFYKRFFKT